MRTVFIKALASLILCAALSNSFLIVKASDDVVVSSDVTEEIITEEEVNITEDEENTEDYYIPEEIETADSENETGDIIVDDSDEQSEETQWVIELSLSSLLCDSLDDITKDFVTDRLSSTNYTIISEESLDIDVNTSGSIKPTTTFLSEGGIYRLSASSDSNTIMINKYCYNGPELDVTIRVPDKIEFTYCYKKETVKPEEGGDDKSYYVYYICTSTCYTTGISTAFNKSNNLEGTTATNINLIIPKRVTTIDKQAFINNTKLVSIDFLGDIQSIGQSAFEGCTRLNTLDLTGLFDSVSTPTIPNRCFYQCNSLENISIPDTILNIGEYAFYQCDKINYIILSERIKTIGKNAFADCSNLRYILISSKANDWSSIVSENESYKLINETIEEEPMVALKGTKEYIGSKVFEKQIVNIYSRVDIDRESVEVICNGEILDIEEYIDTTYGYKTIGYRFNVSDKGDYQVSASDLLNNTTYVEFSYEEDIKDNNEPVIAVKNSEYSSYYNTSVELDISDDSYLSSIYLNNNKVNIPSEKCKQYSLEVSDEGKHILEVIDIFGNSSKYEFTIDKISPTVQNISNNANYTNYVLISVNDSLSGIKSIKLNGKEISNGDRIEASGNYTLEVSDNANNITKLKFNIDKGKPILKNIMNNRIYNKSVKVNASAISSIREINIKYKNTNEETKEYSLSNGKELSKEGEYKITVVSNVGKSTTYSISIDKTKPTLEGIKNNGYYNKKISARALDYSGISEIKINGTVVKSVSIVNDGKYNISLEDKAGNKNNYTIYYDSKAPTIKGYLSFINKAKQIEVYDSNGIKSFKVNNKKVKGTKYKIIKPGKYTLVVTDNAGNTTSKTVVFDNKKPTIKGCSEFINQRQKIIAYDSNGIKSLMVNGELIKSNTYNISKPGVYKVVVKDMAGNIETKKITYDTTSPIIRGYAEYTNKPKEIKVYDKNGIKSFKVNNKIVNGISYKINNVGKYNIVVTDKAGNTINATMIYDNIAPSINGVKNGEKYVKEYVTVGFKDKQSGINYAYIDGRKVSKETKVSKEGEHTVIVYDNALNISKLTFTLEKPKKNK